MCGTLQLKRYAMVHVAEERIQLTYLGRILDLTRAEL